MCFRTSSGIPSPVSVTDIITNVWMERFRGGFFFEPDQQKMLDMALDLIDKARAALKLKKYESGKFGTEKVLMDMAARREIEKAAKPHIGL